MLPFIGMLVVVSSNRGIMGMSILSQCVQQLRIQRGFYHHMGPTICLQNDRTNKGNAPSDVVGDTLGKSPLFFKIKM